MSDDNQSHFRDEDVMSRLARKTRESPFMIAGLAGLVGACAWGVIQYKNRRGMSTSIYLMRLRVVAQGAVVGSLTLGMAYSMLNEHVFNKKKTDQ